MKKKEIKKRIEELKGKLEAVKKDSRIVHAESLALLEGEIFGLEWVLKYSDGYYEKE